MLYLCTSFLFTVNVNTTLSCFLNPHYSHCILNTPLFFLSSFCFEFLIYIPRQIFDSENAITTWLP